MKKLSAFTFISLDGYYKGSNEDISWHGHGQEEADFSVQNMKSRNILLFGRKTYEMMASFWPTEMAYDAFPEVAKGMNAAQKIVFSRTLKQADWQHTTINNGNLFEEVKKLKQTAAEDITILGSGSLLTQLAGENLIDEFQVMLDPVALGEGVSIFHDLKSRLQLQLTNSKVFKSGRIVLNYKPV